jgi:hypothetical protein
MLLLLLLYLFDRKFGDNLTKAEVFTENDSDGNGKISLQEFSNMLAGKLRPNVYPLCCLEILEETICARYITSAQLLCLLNCFPDGSIEVSKLGNFRVEVIVRVFPHIIDPCNFDIISKRLTESEFVNVIRRLGIEIFN